MNFGLFRKKAVKLALFGIAVFVICLFVVSAIAGFNLLGFSGGCISKNSTHSVKLNRPLKTDFLELVINGSSVSPPSFNLKEDIFLRLTVLNKDKQTHCLKLLRFRDNKLVKEPHPCFYIGSQEEKKLPSIINYASDTKVNGNVLNDDEYLVSCATCTGKNSQVKIVLEK